VPVYVNKRDLPYMDAGKSELKAVEAGMKVKAGNVEIEMIHTPGHTPGSQCFRVRGHLVSGDTLFINACGRTDLPGGNAKELYYSLTQTLMKMPDDTVLCPGHNYADQTTVTMAHQKKNNPYLMCDSLENFLKFRTGVSEIR
jgi:hydroxyacylglutathione hydrolase